MESRARDNETMLTGGCLCRSAGEQQLVHLQTQPQSPATGPTPQPPKASVVFEAAWGLFPEGYNLMSACMGMYSVI